jgi:hypothetical protein
VVAQAEGGEVHPHSAILAFDSFEANDASAPSEEGSRLGERAGMSLEAKASGADARQALEHAVELRIAAEAGIEGGACERGGVA